MRCWRSSTVALSVLIALVLAGGCAGWKQRNEGRATDRDKTKKGAAGGAIAGAILGGILGEGEADEILAGAAVGAAVGAGVGAYMDKQEEELGQIPGTTVERVGDDMLLVHFESDVLFDVDSAILSETSRSSLTEMSHVLAEYRKTAIVAQGHTDATGNEAYNQELSERRADSVVNYLIGRGIEADRIVALGFGEGHPVADNDTADGRSRNRRVDILLKAKAK